MGGKWPADQMNLILYLLHLAALLGVDSLQLVLIEGFPQ